MCGIAGSFQWLGRAPVERMIGAMRHRGPDDVGVYADPLVTLAQTRLAVMDPTAAGNQPMTSDTGDIQLIYNGEIYNFQAERDRLRAKGYAFRSGSDTEVILRLYEECGEEAFGKLRGIFALAIYDRRKVGDEKLLLARDPFGIKPLLYASNGSGVTFASELKGLLASGAIARDIDPIALRQLLSLGSVRQPRSMVQGVKALAPAHFMRITRDAVETERYWRFGLDRIPGLRGAPYDEQVERLDAAIGSSVSLQMIADVPVGAFLSGGLDSSLIVARMAQERGANIKTFSVGFEQGADAHDESQDAELIARRFETDHTRVVITGDNMRDHLGSFVKGLDQPSVDGLNSYFVSFAAGQSVTVALSGTGGDELFLGYPWFAGVQQALEAVEQGQRGPITRRLARLPFGDRLVSGLFSRGITDAELYEIYGRQYHCFGPALAHELLSPEQRAGSRRLSLAEDAAESDELQSGSWLERASVMCLSGYTRNQLLRDIDACAMAHSLEVRVPFLDTEIADFALSLPTGSKLAMSPMTLDPATSYADSGVKRILCDVARRYLPDTFFTQRAKRGFSLPYADWLKGPLAPYAEDTLSPASVAAAGLFDPDAVSRIYTEFKEGRRPWSHPWILMVTELWRREILHTER